MKTIVILLTVLGAVLCFGRLIWLRAQPRNNEGCWLKLPGHIRAEDRRWLRRRRRREQPAKP